MNGLVKTSIKVRKAHLMTGMMAAMVQLASQDLEADDELLNRVKTLLENFKAKLEAGLAEAASAEEAAI
jgi:hypothetical protein